MGLYTLLVWPSQKVTVPVLEMRIPGNLSDLSFPSISDISATRLFPGLLICCEHFNVIAFGLTGVPSQLAVWVAQALGIQICIRCHGAPQRQHSIILGG